MDDIGLVGTEELADLLQVHASEIRVVCGHIHNTMIASVGTKVALSAPSPCSSFPFDTRHDGPAGFMTQEDGFLLHRWQQGFQSVRISIEPASGPFPF